MHFRHHLIGRFGLERQQDMKDACIAEIEAALFAVSNILPTLLQHNPRSSL